MAIGWRDVHMWTCLLEEKKTATATKWTLRMRSRSARRNTRFSRKSCRRTAARLPGKIDSYKRISNRQHARTRTHPRTHTDTPWVFPLQQLRHLTRPDPDGCCGRAHKTRARTHFIGKVREQSTIVIVIHEPKRSPYTTTAGVFRLELEDLYQFYSLPLAVFV